MSVSKKVNFFNRRRKVGKTRVTLNTYKTECDELNNKLDLYAIDLNNGFDFYNPSTLKKFIRGYQEIENTFYECYKAEQEILRLNKDSRIIVKYNGFKTTEAFNKDILETI